MKNDVLLYLKGMAYNCHRPQKNCLKAMEAIG